jgi:hypothetical protein
MKPGLTLFTNSTSLALPRFGGNAPVGVSPPIVNSLTRYFATIVLDLEEKQELSLFTSMDYDEGSPTSLWVNTEKIHTADCSLVQCVIHECASRSSSTSCASDLRGHALETEAEISDIVVEPKGPLLLPSKIGGRPYFYYGQPKYVAPINDLFSEGYILILQFTYPGPKEAPKGEWPFFDFTFHLFAKETSDGITWRYGWG